MMLTPEDVENLTRALNTYNARRYGYPDLIDSAIDDMVFAADTLSNEVYSILKRALA